MKTLNLCHTITDKGHFYHIDGKRVSFEAFREAKFQRRQDSFITRATAKVVKNFSTVYL
jgi:hypothetical protein